MRENYDMKSKERSKVWMAKALFVATSVGLLLVYLTTENAKIPSIGRKQKTRSHTYVGKDYPMEWPIQPLERVHMSVENSVHYAFDTAQGRVEWNSTLPSGGAVVYLGPNQRPFTVGLLHQIRCLSIIREILDDFYANSSPDAKIDRPHLARHCMNYLRQMVLCNSDIRLENVRAARGNRLTVPEVTHTCRDWTAVYKAAEKNYAMSRRDVT